MHDPQLVEFLIERADGPADLARKLQVHPSEVSRWRKRGFVSLPGALRAAEVFGIDPRKLRPDIYDKDQAA